MSLRPRTPFFLSRVPASRLFLLLVACMVLTLVPSGLAVAEDPATGDDAPAEEKPAWKPSDKDVEGMIGSLQKYFDLDEELFLGRLEVLERLKAWNEKGYNLLGDMEMVRRLVNESRWFKDPIWDRKWQRDNGFDGKKKGDVINLKSEAMQFAIKPPDDYPKKHRDFFKKPPRKGPWPLLVTLNNRKHFTGEKYPAAVAIDDRYPRNMKEVRDNWSILVPVAPAGRYFDRDGSVRRDLIMQPLVFLFSHLHIDFDRIVLDGEDAALASASYLCTFLSGFVIRKGKLDEASAKLVPNWKHMPTFIVDNKKLFDDLKAAGHETVTHGSAAELEAWLGTVKRVVPRNFKWRIAGPEHQFAHWINVETLTADAPDQEIEVEVDDEKNEIRLAAKGVNQLSLFLNDDIADLSRPLRVLINGHVEFEGKVDRDFDTLFDTDPLVLRRTMFFGLLFSHRLQRLEVRPPKKADEAPAEDVTASPEVESRAERYMKKARESIAEGKPATARKALTKLIEDLPPNSQTAAAKKMLAELGEE